MVMTGRAKIEAAFAPDGARDFGAVICYEGIYIRDHWEQLTTCPWWYQRAPDIESQMQWRRDVIIKTGQDWFELPSFYPRAERRHLQVRSDAESAELVDERSGHRRETHSTYYRRLDGAWVIRIDTSRATGADER